MEKRFRNEDEMNIYIINMVSSINRELCKSGFCDYRINYYDKGRYGLIDFLKIDEQLRELNGYNTVCERMFNMDGYGYEIIKCLENVYKKLNSTDFNGAIDFENKFKKFLK